MKKRCMDVIYKEGMANVQEKARGGQEEGTRAEKGGKLKLG